MASSSHRVQCADAFVEFEVRELRTAVRHDGHGVTASFSIAVRRDGIQARSETPIGLPALGAFGAAIERVRNGYAREALLFPDGSGPVGLSLRRMPGDAQSYDLSVFGRMRDARFRFSGEGLLIGDVAAGRLAYWLAEVSATAGAESA